MSGMRAKAILLVGIAALGIALFSYANLPAGLRGGGWPDSSAPSAPGAESEREYVRLPKSAHAEALAEEATPTGAPPSGPTKQPLQVLDG